MLLSEVLNFEIVAAGEKQRKAIKYSVSCFS